MEEFIWIDNLYLNLLVSLYFTVLGCKAGGSYACQNGGICLQSGLCDCSSDYNGTYCETYIGGCVRARCLNGGTCLPNGICQCTINWNGTTCANCKRTTTTTESWEWITISVIFYFFRYWWMPGKWMWKRRRLYIKRKLCLSSILWRPLLWILWVPYSHNY